MMNIEITKKKMKNIRVRVLDGVVLVSAPISMSNEKIEKFLREHETEIDTLIEIDSKRKYQNDLGNGKFYIFGEIANEKIYDENDLENLYRRELSDYISNRLPELSKLTGLKYSEFKIRKMKSRWGTCYPNRGLLLFNLNLAKRPIREIDSVLLHELIHLKYPNHSREFYRELLKYMPDYYERQKNLNQ